MTSSLVCTACRRAAIATAPRSIIRQLSTSALRTSLPLRSTTVPARLPLLPVSLRTYSSAAASAETPSMSAAESAIAQLLTDKLSPSALLVQDVSGGCGSMYAIDISAEAFRGQTILKQQRMVNAALGEVVKSWHGVQIRTSVPDA